MVVSSNNTALKCSAAILAAFISEALHTTVALFTLVCWVIANILYFQFL